MTHSIKTQGYSEQSRTIKAKKSLGQNFLKSNDAIRKIVEAGKISEDDLILEIGPGKGALTEKLLLKAKRIIVVEKDILLCTMLKEKFSEEISENRLILYEEDILEFDIEKNFRQNKYKIIANIPYNITGAILKKFLTAKNQPTDMVLMLQHEVAKRILAKDKKESILSISVKAYGEPRMVLKVPARYFSPSPKVDSAVINIANISRNKFFLDKTTETVINEEKFWKIVHLGFAHKRKKLSSNLKNDFLDEKELLIDLENKRAEELPLEEWLKLASNL
jgi:16S rRNA (adenine1518-N6/adenine1519-N6)-dimethyltransferase